MRWQTAWLLTRDVLLTGTGLALIISQVFAKQPDAALIVAGLTLTSPSLLKHAPAVLSGDPSAAGDGPSPSLPSSPPRGSSPSSPGGPGEAANGVGPGK